MSKWVARAIRNQNVICDIAHLTSYIICDSKINWQATYVIMFESTCNDKTCIMKLIAVYRTISCYMKPDWFNLFHNKRIIMFSKTTIDTIDFFIRSCHFLPSEIFIIYTNPKTFYSLRFKNWRHSKIILHLFSFFFFSPLYVRGFQ